MKKFISLVIGVSAISLFGQENVILFDDFESEESNPLITMGNFSATVTYSKDAKEIISGKSSLVLDNLHINTIWTPILSISSKHFKKGKAYVCTFDYKVLALGKGKRNHVFFNRDKKQGGEGMIGYTNFGTEVGESGTITCSMYIPHNCEIPTDLYFTSYWGSRIVLDNFKIIEADWNADWMNDKNAIVGVKNTFIEKRFAEFNDPIFRITKEKFFPFVDKYGQFKHRDWEGKIHSDEDFKKRLEEEEKFNETLKPIKNRDKFGGLLDTDYKFESTGRFRTQKVDGKWFFITPEGNLFWSFGCNAIGGVGYTPLNERQHYFEELDKNFIFPGYYNKHGYYKGNEKHIVYCFTRKNMELKYGKDAYKNRTTRTLDRVQRWGINTLGAWTTNQFLEAERVPFIIQVNTFRVPIKTKSQEIKAHWADFPDFYDARFRPHLEKELSKYVNLIKSPYCIGVLIDNELSWQGKNGLLAKAVLSSPQEQPAKSAFRDILKKKYSDIEKLNSAWKSNYASWDDFLSKTDFTNSDTKDFEEDMNSFDEAISRKYFTTCREVVKSISPDCLYISCRFAWRDSIPVEVASEICDVVAMNIYNPNPIVGAKIPPNFKDKPIIIGEFSFARIDKGNFGVYGACAVRSQEERIVKFQSYLNKIIAHPNFIGTHWFHWSDQIITGRPDGEHFAFGLVDICDTPEYPMVRAFNSVSRKMYNYRLKNKEFKKLEKLN